MRNKSYIIYGCGDIGKRCYDILNDTENILFFLDGDEKKQGTKYCGLNVKSITCLFSNQYDGSTIIIASTTYSKEIKSKLINLGLALKYDIILYEDLEIKSLRGIYNRELKNMVSKDGSYDIFYDPQIWCLQQNGGISRYFYEIITRIASVYNIDFFKGYNCSEYQFDYECMWEKYDQRKYVQAIGLNAAFMNKYCENKKYKIIHPTYYYQCGNVKYDSCILTVYDLIQEIFYKNDPIISHKRDSIMRADGVIAISENTKKDLINYYNVPEEKIKVIYLANSLNGNPGIKPYMKEDYILFVGKRDGYKNGELLIKAYAYADYNKYYKLVFFGGGDATTKERAMISKLGLEGRVIFLSGDDAILANLYKHSKCFVYPTEYEGFGLPILEAMHYGTPVITTETSSLVEVGADAVCYYEKNDVESLRYVIEKMLTDNEERLDYIKRGFKREMIFSWEKTARETAEFYSHFIS